MKRKRSGGFPAAGVGQDRNGRENRHSDVVLGEGPLDRVTFPQRVIRGGKVSTIATDVARTTPEVRLVADQAVEIVLLPQGSAPSIDPINLARGEALPSLHDCLQCKCSGDRKQDVHVVRHDHPGMLSMTLALEMRKSMANESSHIAVAQNARTMVSVEPPFNPLRKSPHIFSFDPRSPRPWIESKPSFLLRLPLEDPILRERVMQPERDEICGTGLLPVRKPVLRHKNRIARLEISHWRHVLDPNDYERSQTRVNVKERRFSNRRNPSRRHFFSAAGKPPLL